ncbi:sodium-dependent transporter [uncultured Eubacterium sp.]|uniref:sodium-dependent transporter n=1 Tax=uncultured Eubacterium sp. TaxID=165185 RepID=UPI0015B109A2|nr:sodium-dependent transporter [uncultured Eubacterium sp.]
MENKRSSFKGSIGFVLAAAGSAVGLGNIWRFPYLAAKDNGGFFILCYIILALTFGFTLLVTEIAIGRKTKQSPLTAYGKINKKFKGLGTLATIVPVIILPYYCAIGGWVLKYFITFISGQGTAAAADNYFTGHITSLGQPIIFLLVFIVATAAVILGGVNKGIEKSSKILMPILFVLIIGIAIFALTIKNNDTGVTGIDGLKVYLLPDFKSLTVKSAFTTIFDALGQLFYSISVAMGIMIAYGSYVDEDTNLMKSVNQIEIFDTLVALLAGLMIVPAVYVFMGKEGMTAGPGLMFIALPKVFDQMGAIGNVIGVIFFAMVLFAAITSSISIMEAVVSSLMDGFKMKRKPATLLVLAYGIVAGIIVCLGYNKLYFELSLPNGAVGQILDVMDYVSNNIFMPIVALATCILIGWVAKPKTVIDEVTKNGAKFNRKFIYNATIKVIAPALLVVLLLQALGIIKFQ